MGMMDTSREFVLIAAGHVRSLLQGDVFWAQGIAAGGCVLGTRTNEMAPCVYIYIYEIYTYTGISNCLRPTPPPRLRVHPNLNAKPSKTEPKINEVGSPHAPKSKGWGGSWGAPGGSGDVLGRFWGRPLLGRSEDLTKLWGPLWLTYIDRCRCAKLPLSCRDNISLKKDVYAEKNSGNAGASQHGMAR